MSTILKRNKKEKPKKTPKQEAISWVLTLLTAVVLALVIRTWFFELIRVDGESMQNTLMNNEVVLMTKRDYARGELNRGDVVICHYPDRGNTLFVKRLIALPGDTIEIRSGIVYVNGELVDETDIDMYSESKENFGPYLMGEDDYFVMGDNRAHSNDSRRVGPLSRDMILGHVRRMVCPLNKFMQEVY